MWDLIGAIGGWVALLGGAAVACVLAALAIAAAASRGLRMPLKRLSLAVLGLFYAPLKLLFGALRGAPSLDAMMVSLRNQANRGRYERAARRIVLAAACLRHVACPARTTRRGIECQRCGRCKLCAIHAEAEHLGFRAFVLPGSAFVGRLVAEERPDALLLVACPHECNKVMMALGRRATYAVPLEREGCVNTSVALPAVTRAMRLGIEPHHTKGKQPCWTC